MGEGPVGLAPVDPGGGLADADEPGGHDRVGGEGTPGGVHADLVAQPQGFPQDHLLRGERRVQLGGVHGPFEGAGLLGGEARRRRVGQLTYAQRVRLDAVVDAPDPGGPLAQFPGSVSGREDHGGGPVADRRTVPGAEGTYDIFPLHHRTP